MFHYNEIKEESNWLVKKRETHEVDEAEIKENLKKFAYDEKKYKVLYSFATRLNSELHAKGVSQIELCNATGIADGSLSDYRSGKSEPRISNLYQIADYLKISASYLIGEIDIPSPNPDDMKIYLETGLLPETIKLISENKKHMIYADGFNIIDVLFRKYWIFELCNAIYNYVANEYARVREAKLKADALKNSTDDAMKKWAFRYFEQTDVMGIGYQQYLRRVAIDNMLSDLEKEITPFLLKKYHNMDYQEILSEIGEEQIKRAMQQYLDEEKEVPENAKTQNNP